MQQHGNIVWVKELLVMVKTKGVVIRIKVKDKKYEVDDPKEKGFHMDNSEK